MKIAVVGTGYVGLVTGVCFAEMGDTVSCVDIDEAKVKTLKSGKTPIYEPSLEDLLQKNIEAERISFTTSLKDGIKDAEVIFLALPTPPAEDGSADLQYVLAVAKDIGKNLDHYAVIVNKSTVPVGTVERVAETIKQNGGKDFDVVSNPEFLREGFAVYDFMNPDRVVLGAEEGKAQDVMLELYKPLTTKGVKMHLMDTKSSELTKYASNAFLATKISFINEIANVAELVGADVDFVREAMGTDSRISDKFLRPGIGYGGSCFPKDVVALMQTAKENDYAFEILNAVTEVNSFQKQRLVSKAQSHFTDIKGKKFALWGLAFKPETDDIREASSISTIDGLLDGGAEVVAFDPEATDNIKQLFGDREGLSFVDDQYEALDGADALIIVTEWNVFKSADHEKIKKLLKNPVIFDGRNIYSVDNMKSAGFEYFSIGRGEKNVK